ncbi:hypothetical protein WN944_009303 [Citrus x changshan-huyou]|uniref:Lipoxygenase n=1 Tax=Citrus x changshan-huyou TaxID=2935761 RepID=A0AAP0MSS1_9ROSI
MFNPVLVHQTRSIRTILPLSKPFLHGNGNVFRQIQSSPSFKKGPKIRLGSVPSNSVKAMADTAVSNGVTAVVTVRPPINPLTAGGQVIDDVEDLFSKSLQLELVSAKDENKPKISGNAKIKGVVVKDCEVQYEAEFQVPVDFGEIGAILVVNEHALEMYLKDIVLDGLPSGLVTITCESWVQPNTSKDPRIFFTNKSYLPSKTPNGLQKLRYSELVNLRGNGEGERQKADRIYDYDVYNDLGDPDEDEELKRPVLGGKQHPYPRRCRTGRPHCKTDEASEERVPSQSLIPISPYVPRDEEFSAIKETTFVIRTLFGLLRSLIPNLKAEFVDTDGFPNFTDIDKLFREGVKIKDAEFWKSLLPGFVEEIKDIGEFVLKFTSPETFKRDRFFWFRDEEFARETLAGLNPCSIRLITEWPLKSSLDPKIYGPSASAITTEMIESEIKGCTTVKEALNQKKLFILDYHDLFLPYVEQVRELGDRTLYGSRTVFYLNPDGTLRPLAIELTRPPMDGKPQWKQAFTPSSDSTKSWLWKLAKAHVLAHDSGYHQLISHWLRTHCSVEPYAIAAHRQLSAMHPINRLLKPHFRYTMEINSLARQSLINAGGVIESTFLPGKYSMLLSSIIYDKQWRFDHQALPQDLISRGMAVKDPSSPHGLKLTIEDYPFAQDGLDLWDIIKQWVSDNVSHYYPDPSLVESDEELQAWWTEIRTVGHGDKQDETWWPVLNSPKDLIDTITNIVWVASGLHAAVNFGQYEYAAYFPNRPTIARANMPNEDPSDDEWQIFFERPEAALLTTFPNQKQATAVISVLDVLSAHSPDEDYLGKNMEPAWGEDKIIKGAFEKFQGRLMELKGIINLRNADKNLKNRHGAGSLPYEILMPLADKSGVTGKGVPYSISI